MSNDHADTRTTSETKAIDSEARYVVAVEVEMVIPEDDPSEPCYESETIRLLRDVQQHADQGDVRWLQQYGKVYAAIDVA